MVRFYPSQYGLNLGHAIVCVENTWDFPVVIIQVELFFSYRIGLERPCGYDI